MQIKHKLTQIKECNSDSTSMQAEGRRRIDEVENDNKYKSVDVGTIYKHVEKQRKNVEDSNRWNQSTMEV